MKSDKCHQNVLTVALTSATLLFLLIPTIQTSPINGNVLDYESSANSEVDAEDHLIPDRSLRTNYELIKEVVTKRNSLRYLQNVLAQLDDRLKTIQSSLQDHSVVSSKRGRPPCLSGLPAGDCDYNIMGNEGASQDYLRPGGRNPGRKRSSVASRQRVNN